MQKPTVDESPKGQPSLLKARAYLYQNDWANVAATCEKLIGNTANGTYALFPSYAGIFKPENEYNSEVILDYQYVPSLRVWGGNVRHGASVCRSPYQHKAPHRSWWMTILC